MIDAVNSFGHVTILVVVLFQYKIMSRWLIKKTFQEKNSGLSKIPINRKIAREVFISKVNK